MDIGEIDLIVCYDAQASPIRMVAYLFFAPLPCSSANWFLYFQLQRMGRTGRKRKGHCVMLMTEAEERKYRTAKSSYQRIQQQIARDGAIDYFEAPSSILPSNYRPVCWKRKLVIGEYQRAVSGRKRRQEDTDPSYAEGLLTASAKEEFLARLPNVSSVQEAFDTYWPRQPVLTSALQFLPNNSQLTPTRRIGHGHRSRGFAKAIRDIEERILNPDKRTYDAVESEDGYEGRKTPSHTLILPSKRRENTLDTFLLPKRRKTEQEQPEQHEQQEAVLQDTPSVKPGSASLLRRSSVVDAASNHDPVPSTTALSISESAVSSSARPAVITPSSPPLPPPPLLDEQPQGPNEEEDIWPEDDSFGFGEDGDGLFSKALLEMIEEDDVFDFNDTLDILYPKVSPSDQEQPALMTWLMSRPTLSSAAHACLVARQQTLPEHVWSGLLSHTPHSHGLAQVKEEDEDEEICFSLPNISDLLAEYPGQQQSSQEQEAKQKDRPDNVEAREPPLEPEIDDVTLEWSLSDIAIEELLNEADGQRPPDTVPIASPKTTRNAASPSRSPASSQLEVVSPVHDILPSLPERLDKSPTLSPQSVRLSPVQQPSSLSSSPAVPDPVFQASPIRFRREQSTTLLSSPLKQSPIRRASQLTSPRALRQQQSPVSIVSSHHPSPFRSEPERSFQSISSTEPSPLPVRRRPRMAAMALVSDEEEDDAEDGPGETDSQPIRAPGFFRRRQQELLQQQKQLLEQAAREKRRQRRHEKHRSNPFLDLEVEESSDEEHGGRLCSSSEEEEEDEGQETTMDTSFIHDGSDLGHEADDPMYARALLSPQQRGRKTWLDRFDGDKWAREFSDDEEVRDEEDFSIIQSVSGLFAQSQQGDFDQDEDFA